MDLVFTKPLIVPCDLVSPSMLELFMREGRIPESKIVWCDDPITHSVNGVLAFAGFRTAWGIKGPRFDHWLTTLDFQPDKGNAKRQVAYFNYYRLLPLDSHL